VRCVAWHPEGKYLAACSDDFRCYVWNLETGMHQAILTNAEGPVYFNRSGNLLATRGGLAVTRLWDPMSGELLLTAPGQSLGFSRDGKQLAFSTNTYSTGVWEVHQGGEYRLLMDRPDPWVGHMELAFEPGGEMLAITAGGTDEGTRLWDMRTSQQVAEAELGDSVVFKRLGGNLVSVGEGGVHSWPIAIDGSRRVRLGPPQRLYPRIEFPREVRVVISNDYRRFLGVNYDRSRCLVLDLDKGAEPVALDAPSSDTVPLSPDGKWAVTTTPAGILLWDARAGTFVQNLWPSRNGQAGFSPCGRWLVASDGREYRGWRVEQWSQPIWAITRDTTAEGTGGPVAFSPDGRLVTVRRSSVELQLVDVSSGLELVTLQAPRHGRSLRAVFNHDGTMVAETNHNFIAIWDLRRIRERLSDLGLDWDQPPYPPAERKVLNEPLTIEIDYGTNEVARYFECRDPVYRRAHLSWAKKKHELALAQLHSVLRRCPNHSLAANDLAWYYVAGPEALRDPVAAAPLAEKAVKLAPDRREYVNTLGVAYYRLGRFDDAISRLSQSAAMDQNHPGGTAFDFYFLAMSYHELGQPDHAREYMDRATSWCAAQEKLSPAWAEQLKSFHAEADALLTQTSVPQ
jgi:WD40 repeat protein